MNMNHQCALITGATSGIGYELAKLFAINNYNLIPVARSRMNQIQLQVNYSRVNQ